jgi:peptidoglycan/LPS O-acetylase OafA/YrhL
LSQSLLRPLMPELNSLRGLACLAVLLFHGFWWYIPASATGMEGWLRDATFQGFRGVNLFFILSGLLITNILLGARAQPDYFAHFYKRRALRILPAYYMLLALLAIYGVSRQFLGISFLYVANMAPLLGIKMGYGPLWSLGVEEQFYLFWPLIIRRFRSRTIAFVALGLFANSILLSLGLHTSSPQATFPIWYAAHGLALGALLSLFLCSSMGNRTNVGSVASALAILGGALLLLSGYCKKPQIAGSMQIGWDLIFAGLLLSALLLGSSRFEAVARPKLLLFFGDISYGLYLIHVLVFMVYRRVLHPGDGLAAVLIQFLLCSVVAIGIASLSRFTVEAWFLTMKDRKLEIAAPEWVIDLASSIEQRFPKLVK